MLSINTNLSSLIAQNSMKQSTLSLDTAIERMTTGFKINHSKDNAANYSIVTNMDTKIGAYDVAADNVSMGADFVTTASDSVALMQNKAERLRSLCVQAKNGTYGAQSLFAINSEANAIVSEINRIYSTAKYNGVTLFSNTATQSETSLSGNFLEDPVTYTGAEIEAMLASGDIVVLDSNVTTFTSGQKYLISDETELVRLATLVNAGHSGEGATFILGADIDLGAYCDQEIANGNGGWTPIGNDSNSFEGTFDGNGHVIENLKIDRGGSDYQGLFGNIGLYSEINNIGTEGGYIKGNYYVGGLVGNAEGSINNSYVTGEVSGFSYIGGLVGYAHEQINNSYAIGDVIGTDDTVGGLAGRIINAPLAGCYATGNVSGTDYVGGLVGDNGNYSPITNSYATGNVSGTDYVGGLAGGVNGNNSISNSYATGNVSGTDYVGGLCGSFYYTPINNSYATGNVSGTRRVGGLVGSGVNLTCANCASVQTDMYATQMTEDEILAPSNLDSMGFTEANGWTIENGVPILAKFTPQASENNNGSAGGFAMVLQVGIHGNDSSQIGFDINFTYDLSPLITDISSDEALNTIDNFLAQLSEQSTKLGAIQNRLESALESIMVNMDNLTYSLSTIQDVDMAEVSSEYVRQQILQQASATLLATANQSPSIALQLI